MGWRCDCTEELKVFNGNKNDQIQRLKRDWRFDCTEELILLNVSKNDQIQRF